MREGEGGFEGGVTLFSLTGYSAAEAAGPPRGGAKRRTPLASCPNALGRALLLLRNLISRYFCSMFIESFLLNRLLNLRLCGFWALNCLDALVLYSQQQLAAFYAQGREAKEFVAPAGERWDVRVIIEGEFFQIIG